MSRIIQAGPEDYAGALAFFNSVFYPHKPRCQTGSCHAFQKRGPSDGTKLLLMKEHGRILSGLLIRPVQLQVGAGLLDCACIGFVAVDPAFRGKGLMRELMEHAVAYMRQERFDISLLWGSTGMYNRFGWMNGGCVYVWQIDSRTVRDASGRCTVRAYHEKTDCARIMHVREQGVLCVRRTPAECALILKRDYIKTVVAARGKDFAYVCHAADSPSWIMEAGGDPVFLESILARAYRKNGMKTFTVHTAGVCPEMHSWPDTLSASFSIRSAGMFKILSLENTVRKITPYIQQYHGTVADGMHIILEVAETGETVVVPGGKKKTSRSPRGSVVRIRLPETEMVRLVLGIGQPSVIPGIPENSIGVLRQIFPVPLFVHGTDQV